MSRCLFVAADSLIFDILLQHLFFVVECPREEFMWNVSHTPGAKSKEPGCKTDQFTIMVSGAKGGNHSLLKLDTNSCFVCEQDTCSACRRQPILVSG